ncbi:MAG: HAD family hydrolase [Gammaproteobacteria bacterium]|nr:HAD family hydrolase [Gammaproteobacteria bacterium]
MIKAITFDLWDTVIHDDSDEPKREAMGLRSKRAERRHMLWQALNNIAPIDYAAVELAYNVGEAAFRHVWHEQFVTWTVSERIAVILRGLGRDLPQAAFDDVVLRHEEMETTVAPDPIEGIQEALQAVSQKYKLAVVSDAIVSPGRCLREWLAMHGLKDYFSGFAFSDEIGHSKPHRDMFASAAQQLGVEIEEMVHLGDRDHNDIKGPHKLGMRAILFTATRPDDKDITTADAVCEHHRDLPAIVDALAAQTS